MSLGPFDLTGGDFLELYGILLGIAAIAALLIPPWLRPDGRAARDPDIDELAYLSGGKDRFVDAVIARMLADGSLLHGAKDQFTILTRHARSGTPEAAVAAIPGSPRWREIVRALEPLAEPVQRRLVSAGYLLDDAAAWQMRFWSAMPFLALILFGAIKWDVGTLRGKPVDILTVLLVFTAVLAIYRFAALDRRTRAGKAEIGEVRRDNSRLRLAPTRPETGMAVALYGTGVLAGSSLSSLHGMRSSDGGSSGGGGGDGGGCGGGGCGGCGG